MGKRHAIQGRARYPDCAPVEIANRHKRSSSARPITGTLAKLAVQPKAIIDPDGLPLPAPPQVKTMVEKPDTPDGLGETPPPRSKLI